MSEDDGFRFSVQRGQPPPAPDEGQLLRRLEARGGSCGEMEVEPGRPNAHENLGLALLGQGKRAAAARAFIAAVRANASDPRAARHLEELVDAHRAEIEAEMPDIAEQLAACQQSVTMARVVNEALRKT